jgi:nitronate monooxygenase
VVLHDVVDARQARRALDEGVDGIIALTAGAGGNTGRYNPFALIEELRRIHDGPLGLAGGISTGAGLAAACAMGADFAYLGTRFIASAEANADAAYKQGVVEARLADIVTTDRVSGVPASFLGSSLEEAGLLGEEAGTAMDFGGGGNMNAKAWRDIWAAGQSAAGIDDAPPVARIVERLEREYRSTLERMRHLSATR